MCHRFCVNNSQGLTVISGKKPDEKLQRARQASVQQLTELFHFNGSSIASVQLPGDISIGSSLVIFSSTPLRITHKFDHMAGLQDDPMNTMKGIYQLYLYLVALGRVLGTVSLVPPFHKLEQRIFHEDGSPIQPVPEVGKKNLCELYQSLFHAFTWLD
jgi:hypothetical protein